MGFNLITFNENTYRAIVINYKQGLNCINPERKSFKGVVRYTFYDIELEKVRKFFRDNGGDNYKIVNSETREVIEHSYSGQLVLSV